MPDFLAAFPLVLGGMVICDACVPFEDERQIISKNSGVRRFIDFMSLPRYVRRIGDELFGPMRRQIVAARVGGIKTRGG